MKYFGSQHLRKRRTGVKKPLQSSLLSLRAQGEDGYDHALFQARRELNCARCGGTIAVDEHFTKQQHPVVSVEINFKIWPCCSTCYPFQEVPDCRPSD
jgi:hypothetical protein